VVNLSAFNTAVLDVLSKGPPFYDGEYESADFGYGLDFAYWMWRDYNKSYLITTESYSSAGSSGVYAGRICIFRNVLVPLTAAAVIGKRCSVADWNQNYNNDFEPPGRVFGEIERGVYGIGGPPQPMNAFRVDEERFALVAPTDHVIALIGDDQLETIATFKDVQGSESVRSLRLSTDGRLLLQLNSSGRFYLYSVAEQKRVLSGISIDGEIVLYTDDGFYDGSPEGGRYVYRYFAGLGEHHAFSQFASRFHRPQLIHAILRCENPPRPSAEIVAPPTLEFDLVPAQQPGTFSTHFRVRSDAELKTLRLFVDGAPVEEIALSGKSAELDRRVKISEGVHWMTAVAYNTLGFASIPKSAMATGAAVARPKGKLFYVGFGVDRYPNYPERNLKYAKRDVQLIADTIAAQSALQYGAVDARRLFDEQASGVAILSALDNAVGRATADDTLIVSFAGHGNRAGDHFYFLTSETSREDIAGTALLWDKVAEVLSRSKARVIVLLDACHSGVASQEAIVPNDDYATALMRSGKAGMVVLAASKGREFSQEWDELMGGHGLFSYAVAQALGANRQIADGNRNGVVELSELYRYVKRTVTQMSDGAQTPWLSRDEIIGEAPVM
jgi:hypothetical protein